MEGFKGMKPTAVLGLKSNTGANSESAEISTYFSHATTYQIITKRLRFYLAGLGERICQPA
jgi:hypothetical protein